MSQKQLLTSCGDVQVSDDIESQVSGVFCVDTRKERRARIEETCWRFQELCGFQADNVRNQVEHLEALWESHLAWSSTSSDPNLGLLELGNSLLRTHRAWHRRVWGDLFGEPETNWDPLTNACLYLLTWGEAGNLRFCPELMCFIFSAARAFCASQESGQTQVKEGDFLACVVKPIFNTMLAETFDIGPSGPRFRYGGEPAPPDACNYDDWNELFWDAERLRSALSFGGSLRLENLQAGQVLFALETADWATALKHKSHREVHSALPLLVGNYRIFLLHAQIFAIVLVFWLVKRKIKPEGYSFREQITWEPSLWILAASVGLISPLFMAASEIGFQKLTPGVHASARRSILTKLICIDMVPVGTFALVWIYATNHLPGPFNWYQVGSYHVTNIELVLLAHMFISVVIFVRSLAPRSQNLYHWSFHPKIKDRKLHGAKLFWVVTFGVMIALNVKCIDHLAEATNKVNSVESTLSSFTAKQIIRAESLIMIVVSGLSFYCMTMLVLRAMIAVVGSGIGWGHLGTMKLCQLRRGRNFRSLPSLLASRVLQIPGEDNGLSARQTVAFADTWNTFILELREQDYLRDDEVQALLFTSSELPALFRSGDAKLPSNPEARRRIITLARSCNMKSLPTATVSQMPMLSVLIPHFSETILYWKKDLFEQNQANDLLKFLVKYKNVEFQSFCERTQCSADALTSAELEVAICKWASMRMQTLWRTVETFNRSYFLALDALLKHQEPGLSQAERESKVCSKFQMVVAVQQYAKFADPQHKDFDPYMICAVEHMLEEFGAWLSIAYIQECVVLDERGNRTTRYYSCLIDRNCSKSRIQEEKPLGIWTSGPLVKRKPRFRIELPGFPILGHGKSDNQNCAVVFTRGEIVQTIDANQEAYFESSLMLPLIMQEFEDGRRGDRRPGIVGFREHIFSDLGLLGRINADSEFSFGTIFQRTMNWPLGARLHYGHPDLIDKLQIMQQGGVSKGARGLNLSEDVFAGLDLSLREGFSLYREYFHVGKGRDMGFLTCLGFFQKISTGNAEQCLTRQWMRLSLCLPLSRLLGVFYTHIGYYVNQSLQAHTLKAFCFLAAFATMALNVNAALRGPVQNIAIFYTCYFCGLLAVEFMPLIFERFIEDGLRASIGAMLYNLSTFSFVFWPFQSKLLAYHFETTLRFGGAKYIQTGRGLRTQREPFVKLFQTFAHSHFNDAAEALLLLLITMGQFNWQFYLCACISIFSWLAAPFLFNPRQFESLIHVNTEFFDWLFWMFNTSLEKESWSVWAIGQQDVRQRAHWSSMLVPSSRIFVVVVSSSLVLSLSPEIGPTSLEKLRWALSLSPPLLFLPVCLFQALSARCAGAKPTTMCYCYFASWAVATTAIELYLGDKYFTEPRTIVAVLFNKFCWIRFLLDFFDDVAAHRIGGACFSWLHDTCRIWALSWRWARDVFIGLLLTASIFAVTLIPCFGTLHGFCLFHTKLAREGGCNDKSSKLAASKGLPLNNGQDGNEIQDFFHSFAPHLLST